MGGRGSGSSMSARRMGGRAGRNPSAAPVGTSLTMGDWKYTKTGDNRWRSFQNGRRRADRTYADIKYVFT